MDSEMISTQILTLLVMIPRLGDGMHQWNRVTCRPKEGRTATARSGIENHMGILGAFSLHSMFLPFLLHFIVLLPRSSRVCPLVCLNICTKAFIFLNGVPFSFKDRICRKRAKFMEGFFSFRLAFFVFWYGSTKGVIFSTYWTCISAITNAQYLNRRIW